MSFMIILSCCLPSLNAFVRDIVTETENQRITNFNVTFVLGATNRGTDENSDYVWTVSRYDLSGDGFIDAGKVSFIVSKYIKG